MTISNTEKKTKKSKLKGISTALAIKPVKRGAEFINIRKNLIEKSYNTLKATFGKGNDLTLIQSKILNAVQYYMQRSIYESNLSVDEYYSFHGGNFYGEIDGPLFRMLIGFNSNNFDHIRSVMDQMKIISSDLDTLHEENGKIAFRNMFIEAEYTNNCFKFVVPNYTLRALTNVKTTAVIDLASTNEAFKSRYTATFYEILEMWSYEQNSDDFEVQIPDYDLRVFLKVKYKIENGIVKFSYASPSELRDRVLTNAIKQINDSNIRFHVDYFNYEKMPDGYIWRFSVKSERTLLINKFLSEKSLEILELRMYLRNIGVSETKVVEIITGIVSEYDLEYLIFCVKIVKQSVLKSATKDKKIERQAAYFIGIFNNEETKERFRPIFDDKKAQEKFVAEKRREESLKVLIEAREEHTKKYYELLASAALSQIKLGNVELSEYELGYYTFLENKPLPSAKSILKSLTKTGLTLEHTDTDYFKNFLVAHFTKNHSPEKLKEYLDSKITKSEIKSTLSNDDMP